VTGYSARARNKIGKGKLNQISREVLPDVVLHGSGLEFRRATQGREEVRKVWG
jgi:hypothetical protein